MRLRFLFLILAVLGRRPKPRFSGLLMKANSSRTLILDALTRRMATKVNMFNFWAYGLRMCWAPLGYGSCRPKGVSDLTLILLTYSQDCRSKRHKVSPSGVTTIA